MAVDDRQDFLGLLGGALALGLVGDDAGEIDGVAVHDDLAHARPGFKTLDAHWVRPAGFLRAFPSAPLCRRAMALAHGNRLKNAQIVSAPSMSWFCGPSMASTTRGKRASAKRPGMRWPPSLTR